MVGGVSGGGGGGNGGGGWVGHDIKTLSFVFVTTGPYRMIPFDNNT